MKMKQDSMLEIGDAAWLKSVGHTIRTVLQESGLLAIWRLSAFGLQRLVIGVVAITPFANSCCSA